ncbi:MAG: metallophosphoesterase [Acidobacteria bacterium]|nr:metallophosphoesterase [Acidobacteriota bacterium]
MGMTQSITRNLPELFGMLMVVLCHRILLQRFAEKSWTRWLPWSQWIGLAGLAFEMPLVWQRIPPSDALTWIRGIAMLWAMAFTGVTIVYVIVRRFSPAPPVNAGRRALLHTAQTAIVAAPALALGYGTFYERRKLIPMEVDLKIAGLPKDLDGLRLAQLSDIHMSSFLSERDLAPAIDMANNYRPHITLVTGDLITRDGDPLDACLNELKRLRAEAGVFGCHGNHEIYANSERYTSEQAAKFGLRFLRYEAEALRFGDARLRLAGVDYQRMHAPYLIGADRLQQTGAFNVLLSHNPDVFEAASAQNWDLTLAGHTHGGQVTVEYLNQHLNLARFLTPYVYGHYQRESSHLYVTRGIGTVGVPARIGAPPEVALIRLCAT